MAIMKILYITTIGNTMSFFSSLINDLVDRGITVDIATNEMGGKTPVPEEYPKLGCKVYNISCTRNPLDMGNLKAINEIRGIVAKGKYDLVHCHTPIAAACTRIACIGLRGLGTRVVYTAHGFHFYNGSPLVNWLVYYPIEWLCAWMTDVIITINKEDYTRAYKHLHAKRIEYVPSVGIETSKYARNEKRSLVRKQLGISDDNFLLVSVGELNSNKNHSVIIRAISELQDSSIHYAIAGKGVLFEELLRLSNQCRISDQVHMLGYRNDIPDLYASADACVFPSIREGFGLAALEGMASGLPLIVSDNRGTRDYVGIENGICCNPYDVEAFSKAIAMLKSDKALCERMATRNRNDSKKYDVGIINKKMYRIYGLD